ncbi:MAG: zinc ABC transporter substrate-binding protein, partial [Abditibacteriota bacterium]|nr:zinc ABC transporter substrate-binding protein [Abditibacteriota bacterium]
CKNKNILIPKYYIQALNTIYKNLRLADGPNARYYNNNLSITTSKIKNLDIAIKDKAKKLNGKTVICCTTNKSLLQYLGFNVLASYPMPDNVTPKTWVDIKKRVKRQKVDFCIDNFQSGQNITLQLSKDIKAKHLATSNFPGGYPNTPTMESCLRANVDLCLGIPLKAPAPQKPAPSPQVKKPEPKKPAPKVTKKKTTKKTVIIKKTKPKKTTTIPKTQEKQKKEPAPQPTPTPNESAE